MEHVQHHAHHHHAAGASLNRTALMATLHCLAGCAIGEILGMVIGTALGWGNLETIVLAIALAFVSGYLFTMIPLVRARVSPSAPRRASRSRRTPRRSRSWRSWTISSCSRFPER